MKRFRLDEGDKNVVECSSSRSEERTWIWQTRGKKQEKAKGVVGVKKSPWGGGGNSTTDPRK